ncbi:MAG TPA: hypothetical protein VFU14_03870 [Acidimicrobiales bacterium]|nr:hypothetical protein [Acidimicrobiales bacterium]
MKQFWSDLGGKLGTGLCAAGLLLVFLGWNGAASVDRVEAQFPYLLSGGVAGLSLVVIGVGTIVVQNQRADRAQLQQSLRELEAAIRGEDPSATAFELPSRRPTPEVHAPVELAPEPRPAARRSRRTPLQAKES